MSQGIVLTPNQNGGSRRVALNEITKSQLAATCREQQAKLDQLSQGFRAFGRLLAALAHDPAALAVDDDGRVTIAHEAVKAVPAGSQLQVEDDREDQLMVLRIIEAEERPKVEVPPLIVMPGRRR